MFARPEVPEAPAHPETTTDTAASVASRVAFLGFSDAERQSLTTCFRLSSQRAQRYQVVYTLTDADFLVADADHAPSVQLVVITERLAETLFVGAQSPEGAAPSLRRPIDTLQVLEALDALPRAAAPAALPPALAPAPPSPPRWWTCRCPRAARCGVRGLSRPHPRGRWLWWRLPRAYPSAFTAPLPAGWRPRAMRC